MNKMIETHKNLHTYSYIFFLNLKKYKYNNIFRKDERKIHNCSNIIICLKNIFII